jgi:defect-in-organelle-trafficking protein DotD
MAKCHVIIEGKIMRRFKNFFVLALSSVCLLACSGHSEIRGENAQLVAAPDRVTAMLAEAADRASIAIETLAAVEQARSPDIAVGPISDVPPELDRALTVNWIGPVEPIAMKVANRAGYAFQSVGNPPPVPIVVSLDVENKPVIDILRSIGLQLGVRADIRVDEQRRMVEVHYAPNTGVGG